MRYSIVLYALTDPEVVIGKSDILVGYDEAEQKIIVLRLMR
jgi:hypothetical protein